ncbi:MAG: peptidase S9, prolyl oligopeptidase, partial [Candidatus Nephrothrix sp. EaCA]
MLIATRFGNANQLHEVNFPQGARSQLTFFDEPVTSASYDRAGNYFLFSKDTGGNEFGQLYRFDVQHKKVTLLTDGKKSQNGGVQWSRSGKQIAFASTMRNGKDRDVYLMTPTDKTSMRIVSENEGGGWSIADWSANDTQLILGEQISVNESRIYALDLATRKKTLLLPVGNEKASYKAIGCSASGKELYVLTNRNDEYNRIAVYHLDSKKLDAAFPVKWEVDEAALSDDRKHIAYATNENGLSNVYYCTVDFKTNVALPKINGVATRLTWHPNSQSIGFTVSAHHTAGDVFEYDLATKKLTRWTTSET